MSSPPDDALMHRSCKSNMPLKVGKNRRRHIYLPCQTSILAKVYFVVAFPGWVEESVIGYCLWTVSELPKHQSKVPLNVVCQQYYVMQCGTMWHTPHAPVHLRENGNRNGTECQIIPKLVKLWLWKVKFSLFQILTKK